MTRKEYNGYTNYETWVVALWLDNEEGSSDYWREQAEELVKSESGDKDEATRRLADTLQEQHEEANPCANSNSVFADLMNAALSEVDWHEIAEHYVDEVEVEAEAEETEA